MSYILDALRKADAQRERDPARGIHAQAATALTLEPGPDPASRLSLLGVGALAGAGLLAMLAWWLAGPEARLDAPPVPVTFSPATARSPTVVAAPPAAVTMPALATEVLPAAPPERPLLPAPASPALRDVQKAASTKAAVAAPASSSAPGPAVAAGEHLLSAAELPPEVQRDLPKLTITGGVYSPNPAQRLLIVNGLVLSEGAEAAPGVLLAQIRPKTAVLTFRGWRYGVAY
jgi:general secretion pathway protein B